MQMVRCGRCGKSNVEFKATLRYELVGALHAKCKDVCEACFANFQLWWGAPVEGSPDKRSQPKDVEVTSDSERRPKADD